MPSPININPTKVGLAQGQTGQPGLGYASSPIPFQSQNLFHFVQQFMIAYPITGVSGTGIAAPIGGLQGTVGAGSRQRVIPVGTGGYASGTLGKNPLVNPNSLPGRGS